MRLGWDQTQDPVSAISFATDCATGLAECLIDVNNGYHYMFDSDWCCLVSLGKKMNEITFRK